jgi:tRNA dimethylallyltransferase
MQVYQGMDIGTAKPTRAVRDRIPYRMIDIAASSETMDVRSFQKLGREAIRNGLETHGRVIVAGGSGLHFRSLVDPMTFAPHDANVRDEIASMDSETARATLRAVDPGADAVVDMHNHRRVVRALEIHELTGQTPSERNATPEAEALRNYTSLLPVSVFGVDAGKGSADRVASRLAAMLDSGFVAEVERLAPTLGKTASQAVGYKELLEVIAGRSSVAEAAQRAAGATNALVKRQRTYFGKDPRIVWLPWQDDTSVRVADGVKTIGEAAQWIS